MPANCPSPSGPASQLAVDTASPDTAGPRFRRVWTRRRLFLVLLAWAALSRLGWTLLRDASLDPMRGALVAGDCQIVAVEDDGTLQIVQTAGRLPANAPAPATTRKSPVQRVRLLGVQPAVVARPPSGSSRPGQLELPVGQWLRQRTENQQARLEFDRRRFDRKGCWLAYVFVDDQLLNEELIRAGWGQCDLVTGDATARQRAFRQAESEARRAGRGIWRRNDLELVPASPRS